ncbi:MAG: glycosyltransferase family 2 protein [Chitinophagaceae bacterium]
MLVSLIMPTFNRAHLLTAAIESVIEQTYTQWELIIIDDGSTDTSEELVKQYTFNYNNIFFVKRPNYLPKGANACRNYGLSIASGTFIKWIDSDDILAADALAIQVNALRQNENAGVCISQISFFSTHKHEYKYSLQHWSNQTHTNNAVEDYLFNKVKWQTAAGLWRKSVLDEKPFHEQLMNSQEWLMHLKFLLTDTAYVITPHVIYYVRMHNERMSAKGKLNGKYYYHQCLSRMIALELLTKSHHFTWKSSIRLVLFIVWNYARVIKTRHMYWSKAGLQFIRQSFKLLVHALQHKHAVLEH